MNKIEKLVAVTIVILIVSLVYNGYWPIRAYMSMKPPYEKAHKEDITCPVTVENYAAKLRKQNDSVHIYAVSNRFEVWCDHSIAKGKWKDAETLEEARQIVYEYYIQWAKNCIGPTPPGKKVE